MKLHDVSFRWRLTATYVCLLAGVLILFSAGIYIALDRRLVEAEDDALYTVGLLLDRAVDTSAGQLRFDSRDQTTLRGAHFVRLYSPALQVVFDNSAAVGAVPPMPTGLVSVAAGTPSFAMVNVADRRFRVLSTPILRSQRVVGILQVGEALDTQDQTLERLLVILLTAVPLTLVVASWGGLFLARRALAPIDRLTRAAQAISAQDLSRRLGPPARNDELGQLSATFDGMIARLEHAFRQQHQFTADASHELRTPLTAIRGQIEVALSEDGSVATYRAVLQGLLAQTERLGRLVAGLLTLARADAAALPLQREVFDLADLVGDVAAQLQPLAAERGLRLDAQARAGASVLGDEDRLLQVLLNLVDNALNYTPAGGLVTLTCGATGATVLVTVCDTGMGIAPEHLPYIFERFYRVDTARSRARGGAGLGLAITRTLVEAHGGSIAVQSQIGQGTCFTLRLPQQGSGIIAPLQPPSHALPETHLA